MSRRESLAYAEVSTPLLATAYYINDSTANEVQSKCINESKYGPCRNVRQANHSRRPISDIEDEILPRLTHLLNVRRCGRLF